MGKGSGNTRTSTETRQFSEEQYATALKRSGISTYVDDGVQDNFSQKEKYDYAKQVISELKTIDPDLSLGWIDVKDVYGRNTMSAGNIKVKMGDQDYAHVTPPSYSKRFYQVTYNGGLREVKFDTLSLNDIKGQIKYALNKKWQRNMPENSTYESYRDILVSSELPDKYRQEQTKVLNALSRTRQK